MSFKHPTPTEKIDEMARRGVRKAFFFSSAISAEGIHSQVDIPELVEKAKAAKGMEIVDLGAWNDHPMVIAAIKERADEAMRGGGRTRGSSKQL
jgi:sirohydrochlorin ferrochelatase